MTMTEQTKSYFRVAIPYQVWVDFDVEAADDVDAIMTAREQFANLTEAELSERVTDKTYLIDDAVSDIYVEEVGP